MEVSGRRFDFPKEGAADDLTKLCEFCAADLVTNIANGLCRECEEYMCGSCFRAHIKVKSCRQHVLVGIERALTPLQRNAEHVEKCKRHANEKIKYYCQKHDTVGCGDCMIPEHGPCKPVNITDLSKQFHNSEDFKSLMMNLQDLTTANHENDRKVHKIKKANQVMLDKALQEIKMFRSQINIYLDKVEARIIKDAKDIERNNNKIQVRLEQDCKLLSSKITEVRHNLDMELYLDSELFIQTVNFRRHVLDIEREVLQIQRENDVRTFEFMPDKQLQDIVTSIGKLGSLSRNERQSPTTPPVTTRLTKGARRGENEGHVRQRQPVKVKKGKGQEQAKQIAVGAPVRRIMPFFGAWQHQHQLGTVTAVNSDGSVDAKSNATEQEEVQRIFVGVRVRPTGDFSRLNYYYHKGKPGTVTAVNYDSSVNVTWDKSGETTRCSIGCSVELM